MSDTDIRNSMGTDERFLQRHAVLVLSTHGSVQLEEGRLWSAGASILPLVRYTHRVRPCDHRFVVL